MTALRAGWALVVLASALMLAWMLPGRLDTDLFALLPQTELSDAEPGVAEVNRHFQRRVLFVLAPADDGVDLRKPGETLHSALTGSALFADVDGWHADDTAQRLTRFLLPHRAYLLAPADRAALLAGDTEKFRDAVLDSVLSPGTVGRTTKLMDDPFGTLHRFIVAAADTQATAETGNAWIAEATLTRSPFELDYQQRVAALADTLARAQPDGVALFAGGVVFHAAAAARSAQTEVGLIGGASIAFICVLMFVSFRSLRPLAAVLLVVASSTGVAAATTLVLFGTLHLVALVFGATIIGVVVDYALHYLCALQAPSGMRARVLAGLRLSVVTSGLAYLALAVPDFPGLRQVAVIGAVGLPAGLASVLLWMPLLGRDVRLRVGLGNALRRVRAAAARPGLAAAMLTGVAALALTVGYGARFDDDVTAINPEVGSAMRDEHEIRQHLPQARAERYLLVSGASADEVLAAERALRPVLERLRGAGDVGAFTATAAWAPPVAIQRDNQRLLAGLFEPDAGMAHALLPLLGFDTGALVQLEQTFTLPLAAPLRPGDLPAFLGMSWIGATPAGHLSIVSLDGVAAPDALRAAVAGMDAVHLVSPRAHYTQMLLHYRERATVMLLIAYGVAALVLLRRYGARRGGWAMLPSVAGLLAALGATDAVMGSLNLFHLLGGFMVLGLGLDFAIMQAESEAGETLAATALSAATTLVAFGLLTLSATPAIQAFGAVVLVGVLCAWLLALLAQTLYAPVPRCVAEVPA